MTPFGERVRALRAARGVQLKDMATELHISAAYLSALEHGRRGVPSAMLIRQICNYFGIIWDEAEELEHLALVSDPRVAVDTSGLSAKATELANRLARTIRTLDEGTLDALLTIVRKAEKPR
ncbi:MAG TPA: helix-turn-helix transcriptional regulator [Azospirillaceae bacterium]|nr:helix-turn-helix transcriptional regulator [Azospirillaceae bacterium]